MTGLLTFLLLAGLVVAGVFFTRSRMLQHIISRGWEPYPAKYGYSYEDKYRQRFRRNHQSHSRLKQYDNQTIFRAWRIQKTLDKIDVLTAAPPKDELKVGQWMQS